MDWRYNTVWFDQLRKSEVRSADFSKPGTSRETLLGGRYLVVRSFSSKHGDFEDFPANGSVKYIGLTLANIRSFKGVSVLGNVKRIELHYCLKLESDSGLSDVSDSLEWLHINQSKKLCPGKELLSLSGLKVLCLNSCAPLPDLKFLSRFPHLVDFRFVNTNVLSGDLSPILRHPTLCSVGFLNKRHYNMSSEELERKLAERRTGSVSFAHKGRYRTYRYRAMDA